MRIKAICFLFFSIPPLPFVHAQGAVPTFQHVGAGHSYTLAGRDPALGGTTNIPTVLVSIRLSFDHPNSTGEPTILDAGPDIPRLLRSPVFSTFAFPSGGNTQ